MNVLKNLVKKTDSTIAATAARTSTQSSAKDESNRSSSNRSDSAGDNASDGADPSLSYTSRTSSLTAPSAVSPPPAIVSRLCTSTWDDGPYSLTEGRSAYGAAVVVQAREVGKKKKKKGKQGGSSTAAPVILVAGGKGSRRGRTVVLDTVEVFDPDRCNQAQLCSHTLSTARFSCGAFAVADDTMCILGGKSYSQDGGRAQYLASAELVTPTSSSLLPECNFNLPSPMASFGVAVVGDKVMVIGGNTADSTLASVFEADLSHFVLAAKGNDDTSIGNRSVWHQVDTLNSMHPRHSFSFVVVDDFVCLIIGGFDGVKLLDSVVMYDSQKRKFLDHPATLSIPRAGPSSFTLGKNIIVSGGVVPGFEGSHNEEQAARRASLPSSVSDHSRKPMNITEVLAQADMGLSKDVIYGLPNLADCVQMDQIILELGYKAYAIGQFNFSNIDSPIPTPAITSLDLVPFRGLLRNTTVPRPFPKPFVPDAPANPTMDTDPKILKTTIDIWKKQYEETTNEYRQRLSAEKSTAKMLYDEVVSSLKTEVQITTQILDRAKPDGENSRDRNEVSRKIKEKREAFELEQATLTRELEDRIDKRNLEFESVRSKNEAVLRKLKCAISDYTIRFQEYGEKTEKEFSVWSSMKKKDIGSVESILCGDITEDRKRIMKVLQGDEPQEPAEVSSEYGKHCTNNFSAKKKIGSGGFGVVYLGIDTHLKLGLGFQPKFAIKRVSVLVTDPQMQESILQTFKREISKCDALAPHHCQTLKRVRHPNIVALYGYHVQPDCKSSCLIYEHLERGNVATYLETEDGRMSLPYLRRLRIMTETLRALNFLHTCGCAGFEIQHRDIKPHNICLTNDWSAKLIDCGLARFERTDQSDYAGSGTIFSSNNGFSFAGTPRYICHAYWNGLRPYQSACDIYSFGIVMMELIHGSLNQESKDDPGDFFNHFVESTRGVPVEDGAEKLMERCDDLLVWNMDDLKLLCKRAVQCLSKNLNERPTAQILASEVTEILLRGEIGGVPGSFVKSFSKQDINMYSGASRCAVCNEARTVLKECSMLHILCDQCITQEAIVASRNGRKTVPCPIMQCVCKFDIKEHLYGIVPKDIYDKIYKKTSAEGKILGYLRKIERGQNRLMSQVSQVRKGVNRGLQAMASLTADGCSSCPNIVWIVPGDSIKIDIQRPKTWIQGLTDIPVKVYFFCEHDFTPIVTPVTMTVPKRWLRRVAPALKISIFFLRIANSACGIILPFLAELDMAVDQLFVWTRFVDSILEDADRKLLDKVEPLFTDGLEEFETAKVKALTGRAYKLLEHGVQTGGQMEWKDELKPVLNENGAQIWVQYKFAHHYKI